MKTSGVALTLCVLLAACERGQPPAAAPTAAAVEPPAKLVMPAKPKPADGPFGLKMGMSQEEVERFAKLERKGATRFDSNGAPVPHPLFEDYIYRFGDGIGLCNVKAISKTIPTNVFGAGAKEAFESISEPLEEKYGKATFTIDRVRRGSLWTKPEHWTMGLLKEDRELRKSWFVGELEGMKNESKLPIQNVESIVLETLGTGMNDVVLALEYSFSNNDECVKQEQKSKNKAL